MTNAEPLTVVVNGNGHSSSAAAALALSPASSNGSSNGAAGKKRSTPFTVSPGDDDEDNGPSVTSKLLKLSHQGYGAAVNTWSGQPSHMDQEVSW